MRPVAQLFQPETQKSHPTLFQVGWLFDTSYNCPLSATPRKNSHHRKINTPLIIPNQKQVNHYLPVHRRGLLAYYGRAITAQPA
ncbi:MAG: hypothetical protein P8X63_15550, partial [Desulfuromonadaceae bacterium]